MLAESTSTIAAAAMNRRATRVFLIADDLTGALDAAAPFAAPDAPVEVRWSGAASPRNRSLAFDSGTRERDPEAARSRLAALVGSAACGDETICFAKLDSLLRGNAAAEILAWMETLQPARCLIAPAFPYQGRISRGGRQYFLKDGAWAPTATDLCADLRARGFTVELRRPGETAPDGVSFWDAESDADLACVVTAGRAAAGATLWCGSAGLAAALAAGRPCASVDPWGNGPVLGLFGSDHPVTAGQIDACGDLAFAIGDDIAAAANAVQARLARDGVVLVRPIIVPGTGRPAAAAAIERRLSALVSRLDPPGTLVVAGGETLRGLCAAIGADRLELDGEIVPGVATSSIGGGRFDGVRVVSKSGAFGDRDLLRRLLAQRRRSVSPSIPGHAP